MPEPTAFVDQAEPILSGEPTINDDQRADLWDVFHASKSPEELIQHLQSRDVHPDLKNRLVSAKVMSTPQASPIDRVTDAISRLKNMDPQTLELAETHPKVTAALVSAAEKQNSAETEKKVARKGAQEGEKVAKHLEQPERQDGLQHFPPLQDGHYRVQASDGGVHDIPAENIDQARQIDPNLFVMNP